ncbi:MAG: PIN domain-containing protein [Gallionella sp.]|nr:PIN domain-containing protein [Gallionella sp.]MDD4947069.1 PIN domain-containing protein [Gallionella sp.]MDD5613424.1 PIN domain-containing protein [Gallionella sp.]
MSYTTTQEANVPVFLDSNIVLYALGDDEAKRIRASELLAALPTVSTQVINECSHVLRRKYKLSVHETAAEMENVIDLVQMVGVGLPEIRIAWSLAGKYGFSHYDCLILAAALASGCTTLYTEDMQHGQVIENSLTLCNPFKPK